METKNTGLDYKDENGELRYELKNGAMTWKKQMVSPLKNSILT